MSYYNYRKAFFSAPLVDYTFSKFFSFGRHLTTWISVFASHHDLWLFILNSSPLTFYVHFSLKICKKSFTRRPHLEEHMILHSQDKPFKCTYCEEHFKSRFARLKHQEKFHLGKQISLSRSILATIDASHRAGGGGCCGLTGRKPHNLGRRGFAAVLRNEYIQGFCEVWAGGQMCSWSNCIHLPSIVG